MNILKKWFWKSKLGRYFNALLNVEENEDLQRSFILDMGDYESHFNIARAFVDKEEGFNEFSDYLKDIASCAICWDQYNKLKDL
jgi:hypothetical protein